MSTQNAFLGIDVGSISTKAVIIDEHNTILAQEYIWTEGNPIGAVKKLLGLLEKQLDRDTWQIVGVGATGSARRLVGSIVGATVVKNEITAHAVGTTTFHPDVRTILEIGGQDSKIILVENGIAVDYAMNTLCAAGTGAFLSSQARRLGIDVEEMGQYALQSAHPTMIAARCTVFAAQNPDGTPAGGYHRRRLPGGGVQLYQQCGQGKEDLFPCRVPGRRQQERGRCPRL